jgi:HAD superfamily hydrolase (TIGR01549 family)
MNEHIRAVIWDYDCTLADTWYKNLVVTRKIIKNVTGRDTTKISALSSLENYHVAATRSINWRKFYIDECGLTEAQADQSGRSWTEFQLRDTTLVQFFDGIAEVLLTLKHIPHGIVSQNSKRGIAKALQEGNLLKHFGCIVGYEEVDFDKQKPEPDALLLCLGYLIGSTPGYVFYIGDHEVDVTCVFNANQMLQQNGQDIQVISIGAFYGCDRDDTDWKIKPDYKAQNTRDIIQIVQNFQANNLDK